MTSPAVRWWFRLVVPATFALIVYLGACATLMLLDRQWPGFVALPWMEHPDGWRQVLGGLSGAVAVPLLLGVLWGPYQRVAAIAGVFWLSAIMCVLSFLFGLTMLPETRGKTLEEIAESWRQK